jgi:hypothetical protein
LLLTLDRIATKRIVEVDKNDIQICLNVDVVTVVCFLVQNVAVHFK